MEPPNKDDASSSLTISRMRNHYYACGYRDGKTEALRWHNIRDCYIAVLEHLTQSRNNLTAAIEGIEAITTSAGQKPNVEGDA